MKTWLLFTALCFALAANVAQPIENVGMLQKNVKLPDFSMRDSKGTIWTQDSLMGKNTLMYFWFLDTTALRSLSELNAFADSLPDKNFLFLAPGALSYEDMVSIYQQKDIRFVGLADEKVWMFNVLQINQFPLLIWIDKEGFVKDLWAGAGEHQVQKWIAIIKNAQ